MPRADAIEPLPPVPASKLHHPTPAGHTIARPRLLPDDSVARDMQIGAVVAPAGYGASTAAIQIAHHLDPQHCWLNIARSDNDPVRFLSHLAASLRLGEAVTREVHQALDKGVRAASDLVRAELDRLTGPTLLVLDGLHNLVHVELTDALAEWVDMPPPNFRLLFTSRREPTLPLDRVRVRGHLFELRAEDLALTHAEATEVLQQIESCKPADAATVDQLWERTAGWPTAFYLAVLDLGTDGGMVPTSLGRYLDIEVLAELPLPARRFLSETSVLEILHPDACAELTGEPDALAMLEWLVTAHVLTTRAQTPEATFEYHPMLREHLRLELSAIDIERYERLSNRAAHWYKERGDLVSALSYATHARNVPLGKRLVAQSWRRVADRAIFDSVHNWATTMGPDATADGIVCMTLAWGALVHRDRASMHSWIERARTYTTSATATTVIISTELMLAHWHCICGELDDMYAHVQLAKAEANRAARDDESPNLTPALTIAVTCIDGICALLRGDLERAGELLRAANLPVREPDQEQALLDVLNYLALTEALLGHLDQALVHADEAILRKERRPETSPSCSMAHLTRSIAYLATEDWERATDALQRSQQARDSQLGPVECGLIHVQEARLHHYRGQLDDAHRALRHASLIERETSDSLLQTQIRSAANELRFLGQGTNDQLPPGARELTSREIEVMRALRHPASRREVAGQLHISENTLKTHMTSISRKLGASGRQAIVARAVDLGLLT